MVKSLKSIYIASASTSGPYNVNLVGGMIEVKMREKFSGVRVFDPKPAPLLLAARRETVEKMVNYSDVLIAVIDKNWTFEGIRIGQKSSLDSHDPLHNPQNLDRIAIATALKGNTPVIPVLVGGASMPKADKLPNDLGPLTHLDAIKFRSSSSEEDMRRLVNTVEGYVGQQEGSQQSAISERISESLLTKSEVSPSEAVREPKPTQPDPTQADTLRPETIFMSYSRKDWDEFVKPLVFDFRQRGLKAWIDQQGIRSGTDWSDAIDKALRTCQRMVVCVSPNSMESEQVKREYRFFLHKNKTVFPLLCREADNTPYDLDAIQYISYEYRSKLVEELLG
jgi:TIR domain